MRITFISPPLGLGGGTKVIAIYAERLRRRGHDVAVVYLPLPRPGLREVVRSLRHGRGIPSFARTGPSHFDGVAGVERIMIDRPRPVIDADVPDGDVVVATWWETAEWVAALSPCKGAKVYFLQHYEVHSHLPIERVKATWSLPLRKIVICQWLADVARTKYGDGDVSLVPNSVDTNQFHAPLRGKQPLPTVGLMYSRIPFKGSDIALKAIEIARRTLPGLRLVAFGTHPSQPHMPLPTHTRFGLSPPQDELKDYYAACDAWLFTSRSEGFGLPILEAMACRTPVIAVPAGAAPELVGQGGGILVKPEDPEDMAAAIAHIHALSDPDWRAMSDLAHATATRYTWDDATDLFERALQEA